MTLDACQSQLRAAGLDAWLLTDFRGNNPLAPRLLGVPSGMRRWWYLVPAQGEPTRIVSTVEPGALDAVPGRLRACVGRDDVEAVLREALAGARTVAMEYSPLGLSPYTGTVDAGTVEWIRSLGVAVVPSQDLVQYFEARWSPAQWVGHQQAGLAVEAAMAAAADAIRAGLCAGRPLTEFAAQQIIVASLAAAGMEGFAVQNVSTQANTADCHFEPAAATTLTIGPDQLVLMDIVAKLDQPGSVYADYTHMYYTGAHVPEPMARAFDAAAQAREAVVAAAETALAAGQPIRGCDLDQVGRAVLTAAGYGAQIKHRTGHSLGSAHVHGNGAHLDCVEMPDERRILPETAFTVEPGIYFDGEFGVRTEINVFVDGSGAVHVTGARPTAVEPLV